MAEIFGDGQKYIIWLLLALLVIVLFSCFLVGYVKQNKTKARVTLIVLYVFLLLLEGLKLTIAYLDYGYIPLYMLPFVICSLPLYFFGFVAFGKQNSKIASFFWPISYAIGFVGGIATLLVPAGVLHPEYGWFFNSLGQYENIFLPHYSLISLLFHLIMVLFPMTMVISKIYQPKSIDVVKALAVFIFTIGLALILNYYVDYGNFMFVGIWGIPIGQFIMDISRWLWVLTLTVVVSAGICVVYVPTFIKDARKKQQL